MTYHTSFVICFQQTCMDKNLFPYFVPVWCGDGKHQHGDFTTEANKGWGGKQTDDPLLPISADMHLKWKWLTFTCSSRKHQTDETWEPKQIFHPRRVCLSSGDVLGMIAWRGLACSNGSSSNPQRSVWTSETQEIADRTEKWLFCVIRDFDPHPDVFVWRVCVQSSEPRASTLEQRGGVRHQRALEAWHQNISPLHANEAPPCRRDRLPWSKNITWTNNRDGSFKVRQRMIHRSFLTLFEHCMTSSGPKKRNNDAISDYN